MMNKVFLIGRITQDLELRHTGKVDVASYQLAVNRDKENTDFINVTTFGEFAKTLTQYCGKGDLIGIEGRLQISAYQDKEGNNRTNYSIISEKVSFLNTKKKEQEKSFSKDKVEIQDSDLPF